MAAIDIVRSRERGVMRYNDLRKALRLPPAQSFEDITSKKTKPIWARFLSRLLRDLRTIQVRKFRLTTS